MTWLRHTQLTKEFPKPKYHFSKHLRNIHDYIETDVITKKELYAIKKAVAFWAWYHERTIKMHQIQLGEDKYIFNVELISKDRKREFI